MTFIQTNVKEGAFITQFMKLVKDNGTWTIGEKFFKVGMPVSQLANPGGSLNPETKIKFAIAQHQQATNAANATFGLARILNFELEYKDLPQIFKTKADYLDAGKRKTMIEHVLTFWPKDEDASVKLDNSKFYTYMCEKPTPIPTDFLESYGSTNKDILDVEMATYKLRLDTASGTTLIVDYEDTTLTDNDPTIFQSATAEVKMRSANETGWATNWWPDSDVTVNGWIDNEVVCVVLQCDASAAPDDVLVPTIPLYWGAVDSLDKKSDGKRDHAFFAGTVPTFDFSDVTQVIADPVLPVTKKYPKYPGNAIDDVIVMRTAQGSYHQNHFVKAFNPPDKMPPDRSHDGKQFPSAWKQEESDEYTYPATSAYTNKTDISPAFIVHPEERDRGELKKIMLAPGVGIRKHSHFKVAKGTCPETYDYYKCYDIDAISPITKRPSTQYRPMMLAIYEGDAPK